MVTVDSGGEGRCLGGKECAASSYGRGKGRKDGGHRVTGQ